MTEKQRDVLHFIVNYAGRNGGKIPTMAQIAKGADVYSASNVRKMLVRLQERGWVKLWPKQHRAIEVLRLP